MLKLLPLVSQTSKMVFIEDLLTSHSPDQFCTHCPAAHLLSVWRQLTRSSHFHDPTDLILLLTEWTPPDFSRQDYRLQYQADRGYIPDHAD